MPAHIGQRRSAEQTARLLLSNAFRYDTWECAAARKEVQRLGGAATTVKLFLLGLETEDIPAADITEINLCLFDAERGVFLGAAYRFDARRLTEPVVFQATPKQRVVVELLVRDTPPVAQPEQMRVTHWASCVVEALGESSCFALRPGNAHVLLLEENMRPFASRPTAAVTGSLFYRCQIDPDAALAQLMRELVPPGVFVSESFTTAMPQAGVTAFQLVIQRVELVPTTPESQAELADARSEWSVAAVAHNGYRQLGKGADVPLFLLPERRAPADGSDRPKSSERRASSALTSNVFDRSLDGNDSTASATSSTASPLAGSSSPGEVGARQATGGAVKKHRVALYSDLPVTMTGLPVHATTSLVLAIRCRTPEQKAFRVIGFCVFPLCIMPMRDRDVRVEDLPALQGPFSCEDARMLMVNASTPYGRLPLAMTLTVEYHDVMVAPSSPSSPLRPAAPVAAASEDLLIKPVEHPGDDKMGGEAVATATTTAASPLKKKKMSATAGTVPDEGARPLPLRADAAVTGDGDGIFKVLCSIMEQLQRVRESQDCILQQTSAAVGRDGTAALSSLSPGQLDRLNQKLAGAPVDLVDLTPRRTAVSWAARRAMQEDLQPILHPVKGTLLDDTAPAVGAMPAFLCGIRFEGVTLDVAVPAPRDLCVMFSFGSLPHQQIGPMRAVSVERGSVCTSFQLRDGARGGFVWCEPLESLRSVAMAKFKQRGGVLYLHLFDALTMFYVATASLALAAFYRPYRVEAAMVPMDLAVQRDLTRTEQVLPVEVFPVVCGAGQLHVTLFCVAVSRADAGATAAAATTTTLEPQNGSRLVVAKKLPHIDQLTRGAAAPPAGTEELCNANGSPAPTAEAGAGAGARGDDRHWQRVDFFKQLRRQQLQADGGNAALLPGVPDAHVRAAQESAELEFHLRYAEKIRDEAKSKTIAAVLRRRMTVEHRVQVVAWRPETLRTPFQNPHAVSMEFFVEVAPEDADVCAPADAAAAAFWLGPRERTEVPLVLRLNPPLSPSSTRCCPGGGGGADEGEVRRITATIYTERREAVRYIVVHTTLVGPVVDRRYELFGPAGSEVVRSFFSRHFTAAALPAGVDQKSLQARVADLCGFAATSSERTRVETKAIVDPVTQTHVMAWESVSVTTTIPTAMGRQRTEYITLFLDAAHTKVYETWEVCVFACECLTTRTVSWGQTAALGFPAEGTEDLYCSDAGVAVERASDATYVLRITPREAGTQRFLLHILQEDVLKKVLLTVPVTNPVPTYTQVLELSVADTAGGPVFRRLTFTHRGDTEEAFSVQHNYKYHLRVSPEAFALVPGDSQCISLQLDLLTLPPGHLEGRWPMWLFINNAQNKTVESYLLQVVLQAHPVAHVLPAAA